MSLQRPVWIVFQLYGKHLVLTAVELHLLEYLYSSEVIYLRSVMQYVSLQTRGCLTYSCVPLMTCFFVELIYVPPTYHLLRPHAVTIE